MKISNLAKAKKGCSKMTHIAKSKLQGCSKMTRVAKAKDKVSTSWFILSEIWIFMITWLADITQICIKCTFIEGWSGWICFLKQGSETCDEQE